MQALPLFPLPTVLFPGLVMPLHVFEPRYRRLVEVVSAATGGGPGSFGVVAVRPGGDPAADGLAALHPVGCTAELREVSPLADGRFDIVTTGGTRFRLLDLDGGAGTPYLTGTVEMLPELVGDDDVLGLARRVAARFVVYRRRLGVEVERLPSDPVVLSYLVAAAMVLDLPEQQQLLALPDVSTRLRSELELLRRETSLVRELRSLPATGLARQEWTLN